MSATPGAFRPTSALYLAARLPWSNAVTALTIVVASLLAILPLGFLLFASVLTAAPGAGAATFTAANWAELFSLVHATAIGNTLQIAVYVTSLSVLVGAILAWLVARTDTPFGDELGMLVVLPMLLSPLLTALAWTVLASPRAGLINVIFARLTGATWPLFNIFSIAGIVLVMVLHFAPFAYLIIVSALRGVDPGLEDASRLAGGGVFTTLRRITFPVVTPAIVSASLLIFVLASEQFSVPTLLGVPARIPTLQYEIYSSMVESPTRPNYAASAGSLLLVIAVVGLFMHNRAIRLSRRFVTVTGRSAAPKLVALGPWRFAAVSFAVLYLFLAVLAPYLALVLGSFMKFITPNITPQLFTLDNYKEALSRSDTTLGLQNTLLYAVVAATATVVFGGYLSYLIVRGTSRWSRVVEFVALLPLSVPALSLALGFLWAYLTIPVGVYGTVWILLIAYVTRFTPQGIRNISASLIQIEPELEQSARVHGSSPLRALWRITTPLVRPALLAAWTLLFIQMTLEVSMTVMLYTSQTITAALNVWFANFGGFASLAYSMAVILATLSFAVILVSQRLFGSLRRVP